MINLQELMFFKALTHKIEQEESIPSGDMMKEVFDPTSEVEVAGGVAAFVKALSSVAFVIELTENTETSTYTANKTYEQILSAYQAKKTIIACVNSTSLFPLMNAETSGSSLGLTFGYTQVKAGGNLVITQAIHYLHTDSQDIWTDGYTEIEPAGLDYVEEQLDTKVNKITAAEGTLKAYCANGTKQDQCVVSNTGLANSIARYNNSGQLIAKTIPTSDTHLANKKYIDDKFEGLSSVSGNFSVPGNLSATGFISTLNAPEKNVDVVNKGYLKGIFTYEESTGTLDITIA